MKILALICSFIGIFLLASKELFKHLLHLNDDILYRQLVVDDKDQKRINKYKQFTRNYDRYKLVYTATILSIIGITILSFCK